jgi:proteic killer suppression protein
MDLEYADKHLEQLATDKGYGNPKDPITKQFRKLIQLIQDAPDERDFYAMRSLHFERLKGDRQHQYSMRLNKQWRLILEFRGSAPSKRVVIVAIEDYH